MELKVDEHITQELDETEKFNDFSESFELSVNVLDVLGIDP
jgi:hypothetical protein